LLYLLRPKLFAPRTGVVSVAPASPSSLQAPGTLYRSHFARGTHDARASRRACDCSCRLNERDDKALLEAKQNRTLIEYYFTADPTPVFEELGDRSIGIIGHRFPASLRGLERRIYAPYSEDSTCCVASASARMYGGRMRAR